MRTVLNQRFRINLSNLVAVSSHGAGAVIATHVPVFVNTQNNYGSTRYQLIHGYVWMGRINQDIVKEFMPCEDAAARTINEYLCQDQFVNKVRREYIRHVKGRC